eukprot:CAMPEP_0197299712 /NCGR_PEP_ID=MMETSP0890-20130614/46611_1 /TAXON_ID=44058 ORGANISM="Aureoumbra lagunensis, Strain CCMP1510" /NCGR_SAMPLE_ID=MMETSP0890 /ASSEMBLY_ACC=CAM_ASM_000533 /LENGTH=952 /DNA_ID=CAMNT_0042778145 /DNA_START=123 /DNA_END=2978 /DNA_ORIENTATION=+
MFDGHDRERRTISLGGRRSRDADKVEVMRRARLERQERAEIKRKNLAATRLSAWWRGRWRAFVARSQVRLVWEGQMRDLAAVRTVFRQRGAEFVTPPSTVQALVGSFLFAVGRRPKVDKQCLELLCDWLLADVIAARRALDFDQCRCILAACVKAAEEKDCSQCQRRLIIACIIEATCLDDSEKKKSPFSFATDAVVAVCPEACIVATRLSGELWLRLAAAGIEASNRVSRRGMAIKARRAYGNHGLPLRLVPASELGAICSAMLEPSLQVASNEAAFLAIVEAVAFAENYETDEAVATVCAELVAGLSRGALLDNDKDDEHAASVSRETSSNIAAAAETSDESSDDEEEEKRRPTTSLVRNQASTTVTRITTKRSIFLLDSKVATEIKQRETVLKPRERPLSVKSNALTESILWKRLLANGTSRAGVRLAALVLAACAPAPRVRATSPQAPAVVNVLLDSIRAPAMLMELWRRAKGAKDMDVLTDSGAASIVYCSSVSRRLLRLDNEALQSESLLPLSQLLEVAQALRDLLRIQIWVTGALHDQRRAGFWTFYLVSLGARLFNQLHDRLGTSGLKLTDPGFWLWPNVYLSERLADDSSHPISNDIAHVLDSDGDAAMSDIAVNNLSPGGTSITNDSVALSKEPRVALVLAAMPFVVPFEQRLALFTALLEIDRSRFQQDEAAQFRPLAKRSVRIRRERVFEDGYAALSSGDIRNTLQVSFVNAAGEDEPGIDGGGLFKEFLDEVAKIAFGPQRFAASASNALYPLPEASSEDSWQYDQGENNLTMPSHLAQIEFCGRIIGKALYERVLVEPRFARFFLNKCLGKDNYFDDLESLDAELYQNLLKLRHLSANELPNLGLTMAITVHDPSSGSQRDLELVPRGSHIPVDDRNRETYARLIAHYRLNVQTAAVSSAFLRGLRDAIPLRWLRMFDPDELQLLISGDDQPIDIEDW